MVLADQHNASQLGVSGHDQVLTPNFDSFAGDSVRFDNAYCQNPICTPSRVSILSGQYCHNHGYYSLSGPTNPGLPNLLRHFRESGYRTAGYGKLHLPNSPRNWIADDVDEFGDSYENAEGATGESSFLKYLEEHGVRQFEDSWHNPDEYGPGTISHDAMPSKLPYEHTQEMWCAARAMEFIKTDRDCPFFVQIAMQKPHHPLLPNRRFWDLYPEDIDLPPTIDIEPTNRAPNFRRAWEAFHRRKWDYGGANDTTVDGMRRAWRGTLACVSQVDDVFGRLLSFLDDEGLADNTIVIYSSDHGGYHGIHGIEEKAPGICSQEVCRVPMMWRIPNFTASGAVCNELVESVDMAATLPALCDLPAMESVDGVDISGLLRGDMSPVRSVAVTENPYSKSIRWNNWRMVYYPKEMFENGFRYELYDISKDPLEQENLAADAAYHDVLFDGIDRLSDWLIRTTRVVTSHPAVFEGDRLSGGRIYPTTTDGKAPNRVQPRNREDNNPNYL